MMPFATSQQPFRRAVAATVAPFCVLVLFGMLNSVQAQHHHHHHHGNTFSYGGYYGSGGLAGGSTMITSPGYSNYRRQSLFLPPLLSGGYVSSYDYNSWYGPGLGYGYGPGYGYGIGAGWPYYGSCYSNVGFFPTYGVAYPVWPAFGFAPSAISINVLPSQVTYARYSGTSLTRGPSTRTLDFAVSGVPRMRVTPAPAAGEFPFDPPVIDAAPPLRAAEFNRIPLPAGASAIPLIDEFPPIARSEQPSSLTQRVNSIRHQSNGDEAFRKADFTTAEVLYRSAIESAPDRRAPWFRMTIAHLAQQKFDLAAAHLKTGLLIHGDPTRAWITAHELYGPTASAMIPHHAVALWDWAAAEPLSTDRLLLTAAFQILREDDVAADELLSLAGHNGPEEALLSEMRQIAMTDRTNRAELKRAVAIAPENAAQTVEKVRAPSVDRSESARTSADAAAQDSVTGTVFTPAAARTDGIFMRGLRAKSRVPEPPVPGVPDPPAPASDSSGPIPGTLPVREPLLIPPETPLN